MNEQRPGFTTHSAKQAFRDVGGRLTPLAKRALRAPSSCAHWVGPDGPMTRVGDEFDETDAVNRAIQAEGLVTSRDNGAIAAPIAVDGAIVGALVVGDRGAREWTQEDRELLSDFAETISIEITDRLAARRSDERLRVETSRLVAMLESLRAAVLVEDDTRTVHYANSTFCDMMGIPASPSELAGMDCSGAAQQHKGMFRDPEGFVERIDVLLAARETVREELLELADGRAWERDYVPIFVGDAYRGHLWLYRDVTDRERKRRDLEAKAATDELTGLGNRRGFLSRSDSALARSVGKRATLFFIDLDGLKRINDGYGHETGDMAIVAAGNALRRSFVDDEIVARLGGDEFVVLTLGMPEDRARDAVERFQFQLKRCSRDLPDDVKLGASVGFATCAVDHATAVEDLLTAADARMYAVKQARRAA